MRRGREPDRLRARASSGWPRRWRSSSPGQRTLVLSSDFPGGTERLRRELEAVAKGEFKIVIGTQLVAKGHNFPLLSLVGVVDADLGLASGDPRAGERTFQILQQVTGRAGRGDTAGRALLQTFQPGHPVLKALLSGDTEHFYREEIRMRQAAGLPPFGRLAALVVSRRGPPSRRRPCARALVRVAEPPAEVMVLGPAEAPIAVVRGRHRFRMLVKTPSGSSTCRPIWAVARQRGRRSPGNTRCRWTWIR